MQTQTVPNITTDVGRHIIEEYIDEYDDYALDTMLRQAGAPCPDENGEKRFRVMQLVRNLNNHNLEQMSPVSLPFPRKSDPSFSLFYRTIRVLLTKTCIGCYMSHFLSLRKLSGFGI